MDWGEYARAMSTMADVFAASEAEDKTMETACADCGVVTFCSLEEREDAVFWLCNACLVKRASEGDHKLWDAEQEYYAVVYSHEGTAALPIAVFVHEDEARAYITVRPGPEVKLQKRTIARKSNALTMRGGGLQLGQ
jgi:uncharacterized OB-fold protein